ncbi:hypothetical protein [Flavobacterium sp.]|uniref:hypothetical protein n=1 Tax=Flavobacterium sp. TaxID=239 RepID=UPI0025C3FB8D|nr:hypothetical protein [Flavobacterium sp.]MBA4155408.1 hypothetical protein [Flavobacterium sp.]
MYTSDKKIIELIDILKSLGKISNTSDFCKSIGFFKQNITRVKNGLTHFTPVHIEKICKFYDVDANWIMGFNANIFRKQVINKTTISIDNTE